MINRERTALSGATRAVLRVLIIDDHPLFRDALTLTLRRITPGCEITTAHSLETALAQMETDGLPDIVLLDLDLPDVDDVHGFLRLRSVVKDVPVLIVSSLNDPRVMQSVIAGVASGFVPKPAGRDTLRAALDALGRGDTYLPDCDDGSQTGTEELDAVTRLSNLTRQQGRILDLVCQGKQNKQIAWELSIAETTVKAHVTAIMRKLGVQTRTQAVLMAREAQDKSPGPEGTTPNPW